MSENVFARGKNCTVRVFPSRRSSATDNDPLPDVAELTLTVPSAATLVRPVTAVPAGPVADGEVHPDIQAVVVMAVKSEI
jgi:hypothetical protein